MDKETEGRERSFTEEIELAGSQIVERVKELIAEGNVRRLRIKGPDNALIIEVPVTVGALAGGAIALAAPWLAVIGAFAAFVARAKIEVIREMPEDDSPDKSGD